MDSRWSKWHPITSTENPASKVGKGVYRVRATRSPGVPMDIPRACELDAEGILYIGQGRLRDRIGAFLDRDSRGGTHELIGTFDDYQLERICRRVQLEVQWLETPEPAKCEWQLIERYKKRTGDIPPGNLKH